MGSDPQNYYCIFYTPRIDFPCSIRYSACSCISESKFLFIRFGIGIICAQHRNLDEVGVFASIALPLCACSLVYFCMMPVCFLLICISIHTLSKPVAEWRRWSASLAVLERIRQVVRLRSGGKMRCSTTNEHPSQRQSLHTTTRMLRDSQPRAATCNPPRTATPSLGARKFKPVQFYTQNCRGLKTDSNLTELIHVAQWRDAFASCLQETWRPRDHEELCDLEGGHWTYLYTSCWADAQFGRAGISRSGYPPLTQCHPRMAPSEDKVRTLSSCERSRPEGFSSYYDSSGNCYEESS